MKKILYCICAVSLFSCTENESSSSSKKVQKNEANFTLSKNIERGDWSNIQTEDVLKFDIKIKDFDSNVNVVYVLKPITADATKHQRNKLDYNFQEEVKIPPTGISGSSKDSVLIKKTRDSIIIKKANSSFYVSVLKPGNFIHQYELRKMVGTKYVAGTTQDMSFSAVKIDAYTWNKQTESAGILTSSKHSRYYEFTIDDGDQTNDTYLTNSESKTHTYRAFYTGNEYKGNISINTPLTFSNKVDTEKGAQIVPNWIFEELRITQKRTGEPDNIISYNNLKIRQK